MIERFGDLRKMRVALADPVRYRLVLAAPHDRAPGTRHRANGDKDEAGGGARGAGGDGTQEAGDAAEGTETIDLTGHVGSVVRLERAGGIHCARCGASVRKTYGDGLCYPCFREAPEASPCIVRPELCEAHLGRGRDLAFEARHHNQPHVVYLALTSAPKVGVTRADQVPTRWIDQGAWKALRLADTPYRQLAGQIEVACKAHVTDRTPWQRMLRDERALDVDLRQEKARLLALLPADLARFASPDDEVLEIHYPVTAPPAKVRSLRLDRDQAVEGTLQGIRGQYLILDGGRVLNVRRHIGFGVHLQIE